MMPILVVIGVGLTIVLIAIIGLIILYKYKLNKI